MNEREEAVVRHTVLRPLSVRGENFFVISVDDFRELILTTQYEDATFSTEDRTLAP